MPWVSGAKLDPAKGRAKRLKTKRKESEDQMFRGGDFRAGFNTAARALQAELSSAAKRAPVNGERTYALLAAYLFGYAEKIAGGWSPADSELIAAGMRVQRGTGEATPA